MDDKLRSTHFDSVRLATVAGVTRSRADASVLPEAEAEPEAVPDADPDAEPEAVPDGDPADPAPATDPDAEAEAEPEAADDVLSKASFASAASPSRCTPNRSADA